MRELLSTKDPGMRSIVECLREAGATNDNTTTLGPDVISKLSKGTKFNNFYTDLVRVINWLRLMPDVFSSPGPEFLMEIQDDLVKEYTDEMGSTLYEYKFEDKPPILKWDTQEQIKISKLKHADVVEYVTSTINSSDLRDDFIW